MEVGVVGSELAWLLEDYWYHVMSPFTPGSWVVEACNAYPQIRLPSLCAVRHLQ